MYKRQVLLLGQARAVRVHHAPGLGRAGLEQAVRAPVSYTHLDVYKRQGAQYDIEIYEKHHRKKIDAPSGTAVMLFDALNAARGGELDVYKRQ